MRKLLLVITILVLVLLPTITASASPPATEAAKSNPKPVKVMTHNIYFGADLEPLVTATSPGDFLAKVTQAFEMVEATDFPSRARVLANEIKQTDPHLIGLQEVALWQTGTPATTVAYDFLAILQDELSNLGLQYTVASLHTEFDAEVPSTLGYNIRLTLRDVILARADVDISNPQSALYTNLLIAPTAVGPVTFQRSWVSVDAMVDGQSFRFISTHLEPAVAFYRFAQSGELLNGPANTSLPVILVGDFNSPPDEPLPFSAYTNLINAGFVDTWAEANPNEAGYTCCNAPDLLNHSPGFDTRIDHVFASPGIEVFKAKLISETLGDRTNTGLWPSDHAGIIAELRP